MKSFLNIKWIAAALVIMLLVSGSQETLASSSGSIATSLGGGIEFSYATNPSFVNESASVITLPDAEAGIGEVVSVPLILTQAPDGLAGFLMEFSLSDVSVGSIISVEFPNTALHTMRSLTALRFASRRQTYSRSSRLGPQIQLWLS